MFKTSAASRLLGVLALATILVGSTVGYLIVQPAGEPIGLGGWLTGWSYRKSHVITAATGAGDHYQVKVTVHYAGTGGSGGDVYCNSHCKTGFGDVRFTDDDGTTLLDYWMESKVDSDNAVFWVEVADDLSTVAATIYVYYGKADATTTSNIHNTFIFADDFESGNLNDYWTFVGNPWTDQTTVKKHGSYAAKGTPASEQVMYKTITSIAKGKLMCYIQRDSTSGIIYFVHCDGANYMLCEHYGAFRYYDGAWHDLPVPTSMAANTWYKVELRFNFVTHVYNVFIDDADKGQVTTVLTGNGLLNVQHCVGPTSAYGIGYVDDTRLAKWVDPEPSHGSWGSEETPNSSPYAPTLSSPAAGYRFNPSTSVMFSWSFNDPDVGDTPSAYQFQLADNYGFSPTLIDTGKTVASNWLLGWQYRKPHVITGASGAGTNYQVKVIVHYGSGTDGGADVYLSSHSRTDFGDVRFTNNGGSTPLDYWMETKVDGDNAVFWVKVADDLSTAQTIYVYYGKSDATTTSNGANTFLLFDDWESYSLGSIHGQGGWTLEKYNANGAADVITDAGDKVLDVKGYYGGTAVWKNFAATNNMQLFVMLHFESLANDGQFHFGFYDSLDVYKNLANNIGLHHEMDVGSTQWLELKDMENGGSSKVNPYTDYAPGNYWADTLNWYGTGGNALKGLFKKGTSKNPYDGSFVTKGDLTLTCSETSRPRIGFDDYQYHGAYEHIYVVYFYVKKYVSPEPSHGAWGSEELPVLASQTTQVLPSAVGLYYWRVKTWDSKDAEGPYCTGRTIIVERIKITACGMLNNVIDTRIGGAVWYTAVYESDSTPLTSSVGVLYLNGTAMTWATDRWTYAFPYSMSGSQAVFHITGVTESFYGLTGVYNFAGDIVLNWATMEITISKP